jgi:cutinase
MKVASVVLFAGLVAAQGKSKDNTPGTFGNRGKNTENDLLEGKCKDIIFIMARASTEPGNMGGSMGPLVCSGLKKTYGAERVACQGVGSPYTASLMDNVSPKGTTDAAIKEATRMFTTANSKCPNSIIVFGGYS